MHSTIGLQFPKLKISVSDVSTIANLHDWADFTLVFDKYLYQYLEELYIRDIQNLDLSLVEISVQDIQHLLTSEQRKELKKVDTTTKVTEVNKSLKQISTIFDSINTTKLSSDIKDTIAELKSQYIGNIRKVYGNTCESLVLDKYYDHIGFSVESRNQWYYTWSIPSDTYIDQLLCHHFQQIQQLSMSMSFVGSSQCNDEYNIFKEINALLQPYIKKEIQIHYRCNDIQLDIDLDQSSPNVITIDDDDNDDDNDVKLNDIIRHSDNKNGTINTIDINETINSTGPTTSSIHTDIQIRSSIQAIENEDKFTVNHTNNNTIIYNDLYTKVTSINSIHDLDSDKMNRYITDIICIDTDTSQHTTSESNIHHINNNSNNNNDVLCTDTVELDYKALSDINIQPICHNSVHGSHHTTTTTTSSNININNNKYHHDKDDISFSIVGIPDGLSEQLDMIAEDATQWCPTTVVIEAKARTNRISRPPPIYDQIQLMTYMLMVGTPHGDLVQSLTADTSEIQVKYDDSNKTKTSSTLNDKHMNSPSKRLKMSHSNHTGSQLIYDMTKSMTPYFTNNLPNTDNHKCHKNAIDLNIDNKVDNPMIPTNDTISTTTTTTVVVDDNIHVSATKYNGNKDMTITTTTTNNYKNNKNNINDMQLSIQEFDVYRINLLNDTLYNHGYHYFHIILPRLRQFNIAIQTLRQDDYKRYRYLLGDNNQKIEILIDLCPYLDKVSLRRTMSI